MQENRLQRRLSLGIMNPSGGIMLEANDKLNSTNYSTWKVRMESLLELNDLWILFQVLKRGL